MCIVIYSPKGTKLPSKKVLKIAWDNNDDGGGYAIIQKDSVVNKGFMTFKDFWAAYMAEKLSEADCIAIHFRIGTSGYLNKESTHPFEITDDTQKLKDYSRRSVDSFVMHNGIVGNGDDKKGLSDTMVFTKDVLNNLKGFMDNNKIINTVENLTQGSRLLICIKGVVALTGSWTTDKKSGIYYSNTGYKQNKWSHNRKGSNWLNKSKTPAIKEDYNVWPDCPECGELDDIYYSDNNYMCLVCNTTYNELRTIHTGSAKELNFDDDHLTSYV